MVSGKRGLLGIAIVGISLIIILITLMIISRGNQTPPQPPVKLYGLDFSPYMDDQSPDKGYIVNESQIWQRMYPLRPYTTWIRTYGTTDGLEPETGIAREMGFKVAVGVWLSKDKTANERQMEKLNEIVRAGQADLIIVGSETLLRNDLTEDQLIEYIRRARGEQHRHQCNDGRYVPGS